MTRRPVLPNRIKSVDDLVADKDPFESDEEQEAFLADRYDSRRAATDR